jgi:hypothetical protein
MLQILPMDLWAVTKATGSHGVTAQKSDGDMFTAVRTP